MHPLLRAAATGAAALALAGCTLFDVGPQMARPVVAPPAAWQAVQDAPLDWPDPRWWTLFASAELDALLEQAQANNQDLAIAAARIRQAEAAVRIAGASLQPTLESGASAGRSSRPGTRGRLFSNALGGDFTAAYQLDLFGGNEATAEAAIARLGSSRFDREAVAITLQADVASTYFQILSLRDRMRLAQETLRLAEGVLQILETRRQVGTISDLEIAQQRSQVASQRAQIPALQQAERVALDALAVLLGRLPEGFAIAASSLADVALPPVTAGIPSGLLMRRPDLRRVESDLAAGELDVRAARAARFPSIALTASYGVSSGSLATLFGPGGLLYSAAASVSAPIFQGGRLEGGQRLREAQYEELEASYRRAIYTAFADVEDALGATDTSARQYGFAREAFEQAREAYRIVDARFRTGVADFLTVLDAQRTVFQANDSLVQAELNRFNGAVDLYTALGGGWDGTLR
jgi:multidrug efflux system outer membrane protein